MQAHPPPLPIARIRPNQLYAWRGSSLLVVTPEGRVGVEGSTRADEPRSDHPDGSPEAGPHDSGSQATDGDPLRATIAADLTGWYFRQTRFLSRLALTLAGDPPFFCSSAEAAPHSLELAYVYPPVVKGGGGGSGSGASGERGGILFRDVDVRLGFDVHAASLDLLLHITSRWQDVSLEVAWALAADFATVDEAHFGYREEDVAVSSSSLEDGVAFRSEHPKLPLETRIHVRSRRLPPLGRAGNGVGASDGERGVSRSGQGDRHGIHGDGWHDERGADAVGSHDEPDADVVDLHDERAAEIVGQDGRAPDVVGRPDGRRSDGLAARDPGGVEWRWAQGRLQGVLELRKQETIELRLHVEAIDRSDPVDAQGEARRERRVRRWRDGVARLHAPGESPLVEITERALDDLGSLALLEGPEDEWLTLGAGVPLYQSLWGRDALTASWQTSVFDRGELLGDTLTLLTRLQGTTDNPQRDEEPGRILNQRKMDPFSRLLDRPFARSYADYASPFDFIIGLGYRWALVGGREVVEPHFGAAMRALEWARTRGDSDGDGYLEYLTRSPHGPTHQGWKDSENAVVDERGEQVQPPIAPCEVQGYWYASLQIMSVLSAVMGDPDASRALWRQADELKERFNRDLWMEREGFLAFGLDAEKRPIRALTSNPGQCLATGIVSDENVPRLVRRMFEPDLFSGWGIRTLSTRNPAYNPLDYHLGSVWPVENGTILFGLRRYGLNERAEQLARALYDLARLWPGGRAPECVGGYGRREYAHPSVYPRANAPQTWNQSVLPILVQSLLGLVPFAPMHLLLVDPVLPAWLPELTVRKLRVGDAAATLRFWRDGDGRSHYEVLEKTGELRVVRQAWLQSFGVDVWERTRNAIESVRA